MPVRNIIIAIAAVMFMAVSCTSAKSSGTEAEKTVITLKAKTAQLVTKAELMYNGDADCVAWWEKTSDEIIWEMEVAEAGEYEVIPSVACDPQFPGSTVGITVNDQTVSFKVPDTKGWSVYKSISAGKISLEAGSYKVVVKAIEVPGRFVANLKKLRFVK